MGAYQDALSALQTADVAGKPAAARRLAENWHKNKGLGAAALDLPLSPARPDLPRLVPPTEVPRRRLGTKAGRSALLHAVAHIEFNAIDLALDMICRFGPDDAIPQGRQAEFVGDWISVADDEARHFELIRTRLQQLGHDYGDFPAHNGLWEAAISTRGDIAARLAIAPMVLEARGLDVTPPMIRKFEAAGDKESAKILTTIYTDEINHVATGAKWFHILSKLKKQEPEGYFRSLVDSHFKGQLKPPFNHHARALAGIPEGFYAPSE